MLQKAHQLHLENDPYIVLYQKIKERLENLLNHKHIRFPISIEYGCVSCFCDEYTIRLRSEFVSSMMIWYPRYLKGEVPSVLNQIIDEINKNEKEFHLILVDDNKIDIVPIALIVC